MNPPNFAEDIGSVLTEALGFGNEVVQWATEWGDDYRSGFSPEDVPSNAAGAEFGDDYIGNGQSLSDSLSQWGSDNGSLSQSDPSAGRNNLPATDPAVRGGEDRGSSNATSSNPNNSNNRQQSVSDASNNGSNTIRSRSP